MEKLRLEKSAVKSQIDEKVGEKRAYKYVFSNIKWAERTLTQFALPTMTVFVSCVQSLFIFSDEE